MERFGWTEKQLYTENTAKRILQIVEEMNLRAQADKLREQQEGVKAKVPMRY